MDRPRTLFSDPVGLQTQSCREIPSSWVKRWLELLKSAYAPRRDTPVDFTVGGAGSPQPTPAVSNRPSTLYDENEPEFTLPLRGAFMPQVVQSFLIPGDHTIVFTAPAPLKEWRRMKPALIERIESENPRVRVRDARLIDTRHVHLDVTVAM